MAKLFSNRPARILLLLLHIAQLCSATDHIVGGHFGWNPNVSYTDWINNQTFYVGDLISFRYPKNTYNVFEVNQTGYDNCTTDGAVGNWTSGKDFIPLDEPKRYYFVCGNSYYCLMGMRVSVVVHPLPSPPPAPSSGRLKANGTSSATRSQAVAGAGTVAALVGFLAAVL